MPVSLEVLDLSGGTDNLEYGGTDQRHKFTGGIPAEWCSMTNLKELKMVNCGLDGETSFPDIPPTHPGNALVPLLVPVLGQVSSRLR